MAPINGDRLDVTPTKQIFGLQRPKGCFIPHQTSIFTCWENAKFPWKVKLENGIFPFGLGTKIKQWLRFFIRQIRRALKPQFPWVDQAETSGKMENGKMWKTEKCILLSNAGLENGKC